MNPKPKFRLPPIGLQDTQKRIGAVQDLFEDLYADLDSILRPSRETSLVWTQLEYACLIACKGLIRDEEVLIRDTAGDPIQQDLFPKQS